MSELLSRSFASDLEIRSGGDQRTVGGIVVPYDTEATVSDGGRPYQEGFRRGAFNGSIQAAGKVKLLSQHQRQKNPLGRALSFRDDAAGLYGEFYISKTAAGDEALELIKDGALDSFSVGFRGEKHDTVGRTVWRTAAQLHEVSLVSIPAYTGAQITTLRSAVPILNRLDPEDIERLRRLLGA